MRSYGLDTRRRLPDSLAREVYVNSGGVCQRCGTELGPDYQSAHLAPYIRGGATDVEQMEAWCPECNLRLGDEDVGEPAGLIPRVWQALALPKILRRIWYYGSATLQACPGAGKTEFAAMVFKMLYDAGYVSRMVVVVPNRHLVDQWKHKLGLLRIQ